MKPTHLLAALLLLPAFGCVDDPDMYDDELDADDASELATTTSALTGTSSTFHVCDDTWGFPCWVDLGPRTDDRVCFLGGVYGRLGNGGGAQIVGDLDGTYTMLLTHPAGTKIAALATCVTGISDRVGMTWTAGNAYATVPTKSGRNCFLSGISTYDTSSFNDTTDYMHVWKSGSTWKLGGQISGGAQPKATATCFTTPYSIGPWGGLAPLGSTASGNLVDNASGGWACGFQKFGGKFLISSYSDKIAIDYNAATMFWNWSLVNGKQAEAVCIK